MTPCTQQRIIHIMKAPILVGIGGLLYKYVLYCTLVLVYIISTISSSPLPGDNGRDEYFRSQANETTYIILHFLHILE